MNDLSTTFTASHFADAMRLYREARRDMEMHPLAETDEEESEENRLCDAYAAAEQHLLATSAPDLSGVLAKVEIAARDGQPIAPDALEGIVADLMRLGDLTASPAFDPLVWLHRFEMAGGKINGEQFLCMAADNDRAANMVKRLRPHERKAVAAHMLAYFD